MEAVTYPATKAGGLARKGVKHYASGLQGGVTLLSLYGHADHCQVPAHCTTEATQ